MFRILFYVFVTLSAKSFLVLQSQFNNCDYLDHEKAFKVCWAYNQSTDIVNFALEVKTLGWVGFGFAHKIHKMQDYDVIVGKIQNGKESLTDRFTSGYKEPSADLQQDYTLTAFNESNGKTSLEFHRRRDTGDKYDIEIKPGPMLLVYAYHSLDYPSPYKTKHERQGHKIVTLIPANTSKPAPEATCTVSTNCTTAQHSTQAVSTVKVPTSAAVTASSSVNNIGSTKAVSIATVSTSAAVTASSSVNNTGSDPGSREQTPASSHARVSFYSTFVLSLCNFILTASTCYSLSL